MKQHRIVAFIDEPGSVVRWHRACQPHRTVLLTRSTFGCMGDESSAAPLPVVDMVDDGMTDQEIVVHTDRWRAELDESPVVQATANSADLLEAMRAEEAL